MTLIEKLDCWIESVEKTLSKELKMPLTLEEKKILIQNWNIAKEWNNFIQRESENFFDATDIMQHYDMKERIPFVTIFIGNHFLTTIKGKDETGHRRKLSELKIQFEKGKMWEQKIFREVKRLHPEISIKKVGNFIKIEDVYDLYFHAGLTTEIDKLIIKVGTIKVEKTEIAVELIHNGIESYKKEKMRILLRGD